MTGSIGLYVHFPWCVRKCPYCDFNSHPLRGDLDEGRYVDALIADFERESARAAGRSISSIFFGGGTPSLFSPAAFRRLLETFPFEPDAEITMEANPGTLEIGGALEGYRDAGINRISLGAQSFEAASLARLGRIHSAGETRRAARAIHAAGFAQLNVDLMFGLPQQDVRAALADLEAALALEPTHVSYYQLTIEPKTEFARRPPVLPDGERIADMAEAGHERLAAAGFERYEVSAFARPGARSRHNLNYWTFGDYLGVGAGAHGKITDTGGVLRTEKHSQPRRYLEADDPTSIRRVPAESLPCEFMMNALRLVDGVPAGAFEERTAVPLDRIEPILEGLRGAGLMRRDRIALTPRGFDHLDSVLERFL